MQHQRVLERDLGLRKTNAACIGQFGHRRQHFSLEAAGERAERVQVREVQVSGFELQHLNKAGFIEHRVGVRLADEAGINHGLVHYYFGSNENLLVQALERFTGRLIARQRELYATDLPFADKWRTAMNYLVSEDLSYQKIWLELQGLAWNNPDIRTRLARVNADWRAVLTEAFGEPRRELGIELPLEALVSLVMTFNLGMIIERLGGIETGHRELLEWIDQWISR